jgi:uncharacterized protein (UPF0147 family)
MAVTTFYKDNPTAKSTYAEAIKHSGQPPRRLSMSAKLKKQQENDAKLAKASVSLQQIADSNITPRNIRKIVKDSIAMLQDQKQSVAVRAANAISLLDEVAQDPNMPSFARVTLWSAVSELESIRER